MVISTALCGARNKKEPVMAKKKTVTKKSTKKASGGLTEKARQAAIAEIQTRLGKGKAAKEGRPPSPARPKRVSALDAAARVLAESNKPMRCTDLIDTMQKKGLWESPRGKTPQATLSAAILREITGKKAEARFKKVERGLFVAAPHAAKKGG